MKAYLKIWKQLSAYFKSGQNPEKLALTVALGVTLGVFPVLGVTTILCFLVAIPLKLNVIIIQMANYLVYPLQLITFIPLIKIGGNLLGAPDIPNLEQLMEQGIMALEPILFNIVCGVLIWLLISIPAFFLVRYLILRKLSKANITGH
ncbi:MAG: membrane protein [Cyclobacteriaceae bacterium]|nr:MAG: membrane protein [Cyclobacteriaceae bacterium]